MTHTKLSLARAPEPNWPLMTKAGVPIRPARAPRHIFGTAYVLSGYS